MQDMCWLCMAMSQTAPPLMDWVVWTLLLLFSPGVSLHVEFLGQETLIGET
jgi:hypothetical protein